MRAEADIGNKLDYSPPKLEKFNTLEEYCQHRMITADRRNKDDLIPWHEQIDAETGLYPIEIQHRDELLKAADYLPKEDKQKLKDSIALSLLAHAQEYRNTGEPFSTHTLRIATLLAKKYKMNWITLSTATGHDMAEDTWVGKKDGEPDDKKAHQLISNLISPTVADGVIALTKARGRYIRKDLADNETRMRIILAFAENPWIAIIKIYDRIDYFKSIEGIDDPQSIIAKVQETEQLYIPLAKFLGLEEESTTLKTYTLMERAKESPQVTADVERMQNELYDLKKEAGNETFALLENKLQKTDETIELHDEEVHVFDIRENGRPHLQLNVTIPRSKDENIREWLVKALNSAHTILLDKDFSIKQGVYEESLKAILVGDQDAFSIGITINDKNINLLLMFIPQDKYELGNTNITHMYNADPNKSEEELLLQKEAQLKHDYIKDRFAQIQRSSMTDDTASTELVSRLSPVVPFTQIQVTGIDRHKVEKPWTIRKNATVADYAASINYKNWPTATSIYVNGNLVPINHRLQPGDRIKIEFGNNEKWSPKWIHALELGTAAQITAKQKVKERLNNQDVSEKTKLELIETGMWRLDQELPLEQQPFRIGPGKIAEELPQILGEDYEHTGEEDLLKDIGLRSIPDETIRQIAENMMHINSKVRVVEISFKPNRSGQMNRVSYLLKKHKINVLAVEADSSGNVISKISVYIDPDEEKSARKAISSLKGDYKLYQYGLISVQQRRNDPKETVI